MGKFSVVEATLSLKPCLVSSTDPQLAALCPRKLTHIFIPASQMIFVVKDNLAGIFNPSQLLSQLGRMQSEHKEILREALKTYLQESALRYQPHRAGHYQHQPTEHLTPMTWYSIRTLMRKPAKY